MLDFNLGIEAFQLLVILAAMPWLVLLARSHVYWGRRGQTPQNRGLGLRIPPRGAEPPPPLQGDVRP